MIYKYATFSLSKDDVEILDMSLTKTASVKLPDGIDYDPDFFYMKVRGVSAGEYYGCFPEGNKILMGDGSYKDIKDITEGEYVITHEGNTRKVLKKFEREYAGNVFKITPLKTNVSLTCTEEHPILSISRKSIACDHDKYINCLPQFVGKRNICGRKYTHCEQNLSRFKEEFISARELEKEDFVAYRFYKPSNSTEFTKEEMYFIGLFLAEGSISHVSPNTKDLRLTFGLHEKETLVKYFLEEIAPKINIRKINGPYECEEKGQIQISINDPVWIEKLLKYCGRLCDKIFIHPELKFDKNISYLLQGFIDGDGHIDCTERVVVTTVSEKLGRDLFDVAIICGYNPSYCVHIHEDENCKDRQQISFSLNNRILCDLGVKKSQRKLLQDKAHSFIYNEKFYSKIKSLELSRFDGLVYNLEVEDDNSYIVNGICVHNCNKNADYFPEAELIKSHKTFLQAHTFKNHDNKDVANAIGDVLDSYWDDKMKSVILLLRIDRKLAPTIVRGFEKGFMTDVSMGCRIDYSLCSICGNKAKVRSEYCTHINNMKHKIFPDGRKAYEVNIGPKFHDISAVLNGAEKVAKVVGMIITGNKVAFNMQHSFEKVSSIEDSISDSGMSKVASVVCDADILEKTASSKKSQLQKIAEIKKEIQGKITEIAKGEVILDKYNRAEKLSELLKLVGTKFWDRNTCDNISGKIRDISAAKNIPLSVAFDQFLKVLDFAGIELSPLEFKDISENLMGATHEYDTRDLPLAPESMENIDKEVFENDIGESVDFPSMFNVIKNMMGSRFEPKIFGTAPINKVKAVIIRVNRPVKAQAENYESFMDIVKHLMPERSNHRRFLVHRIVNIPKEAMNNYPHFAIAKTASDSCVNPDNINNSLSMLLYAKYQGDRVRRFNDGELEYGLAKFASIIEGESFENILEDSIEKQALTGKGYTMRKALLYGAPITFGYSALQRSRIRNGENVSGLNRYIAENPANAYALQALMGPRVLKGLKKIPGKAKAKAEALSDKVYMKHADMFKDAELDATTGISPDQLTTIKKACILIEDDKHDLAEHILKNASDETERYLQICKDYFKIKVEKDLEKTAGAIKEVALGALGNTVFNKKGTSLLASLPAAIVDGAALTLLAHHFAKSQSKIAPK